MLSPFSASRSTDTCHVEPTSVPGYAAPTPSISASRDTNSASGGSCGSTLTPASVVSSSGCGAMNRLAFPRQYSSCGLTASSTPDISTTTRTGSFRDGDISTLSPTSSPNTDPERSPIAASMRGRSPLRSTARDGMSPSRKSTWSWRFVRF